MNLKPLTPQPDAMTSKQRILRLPAVLLETGLARSTIYRMIAEHTFPAPVRLHSRAIGWHQSSVERWKSERPAAR